jgi:hypothetical protein
MTAIVFIALLLVLGPLSLVLGVDSRDKSPRHRRASWPGEQGER